MNKLHEKQLKIFNNLRNERTATTKTVDFKQQQTSAAASNHQ